MIGTIRKHQNWLWGVIITVTIISFVVFFSPYSRLSNARGGPVNYGSINGVKVSEEEFYQTRNEAFLYHFFVNGSWPDNNYDPLQDLYQRLLLIRRGQDMGIHIGTESVVQAAREMVKPFERMRPPITSPTMFVERVLQPNRMTWDDFERFIRHQLTIQELISTVGMCGKLITPDEAVELYTREHQELATAAVFFSASNLLANVTPPPDAALGEYYSNRLANYWIPERIQVAYAKFDLTNFQAEAEQELAKMTNLDQKIEEAYNQNTTNFLRELKVATLDEAKVKVRDQQRKEYEIKKSVEKARAFGRDLYDRNEKNPLGATNLLELAKEKAVPTGISTPFDSKNGPKELNVTANFAETAFALGTNDFSRVLLGEDALYIIALDKKIPKEVPSFDQVRDKVTADYKFSQAMSEARIKGIALAATLTNALAQGKSFADVCAEQKVTPVDLPPFSLSTRELPQAEEHLTLNQLKQIAFSTTPGKASSFQPTLDGGVVLYVKSKLPITPEKLKEELPNYITLARQTRQNEAFNDWFRKEYERGVRDVPALRREQPQGTQRASRS